MERWKCEKSDLQKYHKYEKENFHKVDHGKARKTAGSVKLKEEEGKRPSNKTKKVLFFFLNTIRDGRSSYRLLTLSTWR